jgi:parvulin-like peptidyl-prolyl isomerase
MSSSEPHGEGLCFAYLLAGLPEGRWSDPIPSAYGLHSVWLEERMAAILPSLDAVRNQISQRILAERSEQRLTDFLKQLRRSYEVRIEGTLP